MKVVLKIKIIKVLQRLMYAKLNLLKFNIPTNKKIQNEN